VVWESPSTLVSRRHIVVEYRNLVIGKHKIFQEDTEMTTRQIKYKCGYKYQLAEEHSIIVGVNPEGDIREDFVDLTTDGRLTIKKGYAWDGPSGPTIDTSTFMRGSLVHDALYQLMRHGLIDKGKWREQADREMRRVCREDGMSRVRAWWTYQAVRLFADNAASKESRKEVKTAPR
jgi:hypothetical protein